MCVCVPEVMGFLSGAVVHIFVCVCPYRVSGCRCVREIHPVPCGCLHEALDGVVLGPGKGGTHRSVLIGEGRVWRASFS